MGPQRFFVPVTLVVSALLSSLFAAQDQQPDPWTPQQLMTVDALVQKLAPGEKPPLIISVAFPVLYRGRHITSSVFAGPGHDPQGLDALKAAVKDAPKDAEIVIYCGCCPMEHCPNLRPAFRLLKEMGYSNVHALSIPTNFATDWVAKGYPSTPPASPSPAK